MSRQTEKALLQLQKAMDGKDFQSEEEINVFMDEFIQKYNSNLEKGIEKDAYYYLDLAQDAFEEKEIIRYAKKALKLDPYCLDAELILAQMKAHDIESLGKNMEKVIKKGEEQLKERGIDMEENMGSFYGILETRPYMRVRKEYLDLLIEQGRFRHALCEAEEHLRLCENDNLGVRYVLMALYCYFEEEEKAKTLFERYEEDTAFMLLPLAGLYYKMGNMKKMKTYIRRLNNRNRDLLGALDLLMNPDEQREVIEEIVSAEMYAPFSVEEVVLAFFESPFIYMSMSAFFDAVYNEVNV